MFKYRNSLRNYDENKYPYSMEFIKESMYENYHGYCDENGFHIQLAGAKHLFCTPELKTFNVKCNVEIHRYRAPFKHMAFSVLFGYHNASKNGYAIGFRYDYNIQCFYISLEEIVSNKRTILSEVVFENYNLICDKKVPIKITVAEEHIEGSYGKHKFTFACRMEKGRIGVDVSDVSEEISFSDVEISTKEKLQKSLVCSKKFDLPRYNGGELPYRVKLDVISYGNTMYEMKYKLEGGTASRGKRETYTRTWLGLYDDITNMYIKIYRGKGSEKYYLFNGCFRFLEQNLREVFLKSQEYLSNLKNVPIAGSFYMSNYQKDSLVCIGYEDFFSVSFATMAGPCEYIFDEKERLIYSGAPLEQDVTLRLESLDKQILQNIPENIWCYEDALRHAEKNHYFYVGEHMHFRYKLYTNKNLAYMKMEVSLQDAYFAKIKDITPEEVQVQPFEVPNYKVGIVPFVLEPLDCGVYHISAKIYYGDQLVCEEWTAFEVLDENADISPQEASGLPSMHFGDGGRNISFTGVPDFYTQNDKHDWGHYCDRMLIGPIPAQEMRVWEVLKFYKRKLFIWPTIRTIYGYDINLLQDVMAHADYINPSVPGLEDVPGHAYRYDYYDYDAYGNVLKTGLNDFLTEYPEYRARTGIEDALVDFSVEDHEKLLRVCGSEWVSFAIERVAERFKEQSAEIRKMNPDFKRSSYGPLSIYYAPYVGGYSVKWYGIPIEKMHDIYDGFLQLEDYPYSAAYRTTRGAWLIMTSKLLDNRIKIYPELYFNFPKGCPDGATCCAYPPHSYSECPVYFTMTQICEYVYGSAYFKDGKFHFWDDYGFAPLTLIDHYKDRAKAIFTFWGKFLQNKPVRLRKCPVFLYEIQENEDRYDYHVHRNHFYNISESNLAYTYELMRTSGTAGGFVAKYKELTCLTEQDINSIVLPDLTTASNATLQRIRELHGKGVLLIAAGKVTGLEDLFGVRENPRTLEVNMLTNGCDSEDIIPNKADFVYENVTGQAVLETNENIPVIITNENTILMNAAIGQVGVDCHVNITYQGRPNISELLAETFRAAILSKLQQEFESDDRTGILVAETEKQEKLMVLIDYSKYDQANRETPARKEIRFHVDNVMDVEYVGVCNDEISMSKFYQNGVVKGISVMLRPHETLMFKLKYKIE